MTFLKGNDFNDVAITSILQNSPDFVIIALTRRAIHHLRSCRKGGFPNLTEHSKRC